MSCRPNFEFLVFALSWSAVLAGRLEAQRPSARRPTPVLPVAPAQGQVLAAQQRRIPDVVGMSITAARTALAFTSHTIVQIDSVAPGAPLDQVLRQRPVAGTRVSATKVDSLWVAIAKKSPLVGAFVGSLRTPGRFPQRPDTSKQPPGGVPAGTRDTTNVPPVQVVPRDTIVPDLYGMQRSTVLLAVRTSLLRLAGEQTDYSDLQPADRVFRQHPPAGTRVPVRSDVIVWFSRGPHPAPVAIPVPPLYGLTLAQARDVLLRAGLDTGHVDTVVRRGGSGKVEHQEPHEGTVVHPGDRVDLTIAFPPATVSVPRLRGSTTAAAERLLGEAGLALSGYRRRPMPGGVGTVIGSKPDEGTLVEVGSAVELTIGVPERVRYIRVPDLRGSSTSAAESILASAGLSLGAVDIDPSDTTAAVRRQRPVAGDSLPAGTAVAITIGMAPTSRPLVPMPDVRRLSLDSAQRALRGAGLGRSATSGFLDTAAVIVHQVPEPGSIVAVDSTISLVAESLVVRVPNLFGLTENRARDRASRDGLDLLLLPERRALVLRASVDSQFPPFDAVVRASSTVAARLAVPIVPPVALAAIGIVLLGGVAALAWPKPRPAPAPGTIALRLVMRRPGDATIDHGPERSLIASALYLTLDVTRNPATVHPDTPTIIESEEWHNA